MEALFRDNKLVDFTIRCNGRDIPCHKAIVGARSPVFGAMLESHTEESKTNSVTIDDVDFEVSALRGLGLMIF